MNNIIDFYDDTSKLVFKVIDKEYKIPSFVKYASMESGELARKEKKAFALPLSEKFPLDTKQDIVLSQLYLTKSASCLTKGEVELAQRNITKAARLGGVDLTDLRRPPTIEYEIALEDFAVAIPRQSLNEAVRSKSANLMYQDHLCLYPLNNEENIKTANALFPTGLEEFPQLKPIVAGKILEKVGDDASARVAAYRPLSKSAMLQELEIREALHPIEDLPGAYTHLAHQFKEAQDTLENRSKFANILLELSSKNPIDDKFSRTYTDPYKFLCGWEEDLEKKAHVIVDDREFSLKHIQKYASALGNVFPDSRHYVKDVDTFERYLDKKSDVDLKVIKGVLTRQYD